MGLNSGTSTMSIVDKIIDKILNSGAKQRINWWKTILINFRMLPFLEAIQFPILCYGQVKSVLGGGRIILNNVSKGVLKIGYDLAAYRSCGATTIKLLKESTWVIGGEVIIMQGASVVLGSRARLSMGNHCTLGDRAEIICKKKIEIGDYSEITWDCQVTDFASHPIKDRVTGIYRNLFRPVKIGDYCWIGNRTTIQPGTKLPNRVIVASNSILNKDYIKMGIQPYSLIGGMPAKLIRSNVERNYEQDSIIQSYFLEHEEEFASQEQIISI